MSAPPVLVDLASDLGCPWRFVGLSSALIFHQQLHGPVELELRLRLCDLDPTTSVGGVDHAQRLRRKFPDEAALADIQKQSADSAQAVGLDIEPTRPERATPTLKSHPLVAAAQEDGLQVATALARFNAYWREGVFFERDGALIGVAQSTGFDASQIRERLAKREDIAAVRAEAGAPGRVGATGFPTFMVTERVGFPGVLPPLQRASDLRQAASQGAAQ